MWLHCCLTTITDSLIWSVSQWEERRKWERTKLKTNECWEYCFQYHLLIFIIRTQIHFHVITAAEGRTDGATEWRQKERKRGRTTEEKWLLANCWTKLHCKSCSVMPNVFVSMCAHRSPFTGNSAKPWRKSVGPMLHHLGPRWHISTTVGWAAMKSNKQTFMVPSG